MLEAEDGEQDAGERERVYRLRKACEGGILAAELTEPPDALENAILPRRLAFGGEELPLRAAQARLAVLDEYGDREELGRIHAEASARFNDDRLELLRAHEQLEAELTGEPDPVKRIEEEKGISLGELEQALAAASDAATDKFDDLRERWFGELLFGRSRTTGRAPTTSPTSAGCRRSRACTRRSGRWRSASTRSRASASGSPSRSRTSGSTSTTGRRSLRAPA